MDNFRQGVASAITGIDATQVIITQVQEVLPQAMRLLLQDSPGIEVKFEIIGLKEEAAAEETVTRLQEIASPSTDDSQDSVLLSSLKSSGLPENLSVSLSETPSIVLPPPAVIPATEEEVEISVSSAPDVPASDIDSGPSVIVLASASAGAVAAIACLAAGFCLFMRRRGQRYDWPLFIIRLQTGLNLYSHHEPFRWKRCFDSCTYPVCMVGSWKSFQLGPVGANKPDADAVPPAYEYSP
eukprot:scaffold140426_cov15-Prasinocladus_malaysianus.AAC.1